MNQNKENWIQICCPFLNKWKIMHHFFFTSFFLLYVALSDIIIIKLCWLNVWGVDGVCRTGVCVFLSSPKFSPPQMSIAVSYFPRWLNQDLSITKSPPAMIGVLTHQNTRKKERKKNCFHLVPLTIIHLSCLNLRTTDYRSYFKHQSTTDAAFCVILWPIFCSCN